MDTQGQPSMWFEDDIVVVRMWGQIDVPIMQRMIEMGEVVYARYGYILFLGDGQHTTGIHPDARALQTERLRRFVRPSYTAIYNVSTVLRVVSTLTQRGISLLTGKAIPVGFHRDEAEARAELARRRVALLRASRG